MSIAEIKSRARTALHRKLSRRASYYATRNTGATPQTITARAHGKPSMAGDMAGTNLNYAETHERQETIIFWLAELMPVRNAYVIFTANEGYRVVNVLPPDGLTVKAEVLRLEQYEIVGFTLPDGTVIVEP